ncbi:hypothetical protein [Flavobacterium noncentrifugens]|uniref:Uncharacterized protein n=1 Tax=Flavobacterium noncentrifugens TaxID=1128970 RepID=A0A1G9APY9_9FLAO|nr:hypothetical protein [Flavobacterium noncentrifugens]SDK29378.1 hypothetical protein SAMN04487935_3001 [Flavobacterium noncentrifugens]
MKHAKIRLAYRIVIDSNSAVVWDRYVFEDTHREYKMQQQLFNSKENPKQTFRELLAENEKAEQLHYLTGIAANNYIQQLKGKLHRVADVLGNQFFPFVNYRLDIVNSDSNDFSKHKIGITFYSPLLTLLDIVNNCYLISENTENSPGFETMMFPIQPGLAICYHERNGN